MRLKETQTTVKARYDRGKDVHLQSSTAGSITSSLASTSPNTKYLSIKESQSLASKTMSDRINALFRAVNSSNVGKSCSSSISGAIEGRPCETNEKSRSVLVLAGSSDCLDELEDDEVDMELRDNDDC